MWNGYRVLGPLGMEAPRTQGPRLFRAVTPPRPNRLGKKDCSGKVEYADSLAPLFSYPIEPCHYRALFVEESRPHSLSSAANHVLMQCTPYLLPNARVCRCIISPSAEAIQCGLRQTVWAANPLRHNSSASPHESFSGPTTFKYETGSYSNLPKGTG